MSDPLRGPDPLRCTATARSGQRCGSRPIKGATVCRMHGGAAPQVKAKAAERLAALQNPALDALERALAEADYRTQVRIAEIVFDRTGLHPKQTTELAGGVSVEQTSEWRLVRQALVETIGASNPELLEAFEARLYALQHP